MLDCRTAPLVRLMDTIIEINILLNLIKIFSDISFVHFSPFSTTLLYTDRHYLIICTTSLCVSFRTELLITPHASPHFFRFPNLFFHCNLSLQNLFSVSGSKPVMWSSDHVFSALQIRNAVTSSKEDSERFIIIR